MTQRSDRLSLVADIGGTNTRVALASGTELRADTIQRFKNADYPGLETVLRAYLDAQGNPDCDGACVALAGPVRDDVGSMTNLDWTIDAATVARAARAERVAVINDLQAQGYALGHIAENCLHTILPGPSAGDHASKLVIGIGTGFNCAPVHETAAGRIVTPSESGHANLPIRTDEELALCRHFETAHGFPAVEDVLSGRGIAHVASWMAERAGTPRDYASQDVIAGMENDDPLAREALRFFVRIMGTVTGNLSLIHLPFGGVFLVGGVARAVAPWLGELGFADAMRDKGRFAGFMKNFPVYLVEDDYAALTGCAHRLAR
ncbi:ROK family protein [Maritimibacter sp. DP1N21-5]|uniref:glucokinase n=1 Tax=Maritimibacter sp. DP1N21-5 TaxID=2836867 RepID=UPI001C459A54|nr:ROK family protein [Maritimibacter sp. DP1N21-5]MBV7409862.1 glucokinase [Maritimibacter sp. DP1N21-5]